MEPENPLLDDFVLSLARRQPARVCFIPTAAADSPAYIAKFYRAFVGRSMPVDLTLVDFPLPRRPARTSDLQSFVEQQDVFYVGGGNTAHLLALWRVHGLDRLLREAWEKGAVMCGVSAGMNCWFGASITDSFGGLAVLNDGLGLLEGSACPHYDGAAERRPTFHRAVSEGLSAGYAADDGAGLHFVGRELASVVTSRPAAKAYRVSVVDGQVSEAAVPTRFLGQP